jgi:putative chitinase
MLPIKEMGGNSYFTKMYDIAGDRPAKARELGNTTKGDGARFCGRGYVQLTGKRNYEKAAKYLGRDLVGSPDLAMDMTIAAQVMFGGMAEGWFTGRRLGDYDSPNGGFDARNARRIINGTDKAATIAVYYSHFLTALRLMKAEMPVAPVVIPPPPDIPAIAPAVKPQSFWARLRAFFA